jgi:anti-sigma regulatory factor (Ser/Thr protein kinase)
MDQLGDGRDPMRVTRRFPNSPSSVTQARRFVQEQLGGTPQDVTDAVAVMTSELATNSVRHAATDFEVDVDLTPRTIRVQVTDRGSGAPTVLSPDPSSSSGRGLHIVEQLSDDWGVSAPRDSNAKTVWFTISIPVSAGGSGQEVRTPE